MHGQRVNGGTVAPPSRKQQIDAVVKFLDHERNQERSLEAIAIEVVDGFHDMILKGISKPAQPIRLGMLFKNATDGHVRRVQWMDDTLVWFVTDNASYGQLGALSAPFWAACEEYRPKRRVEVDGKGKMLEMTDDEIEEAWSNPNWKVGDKLSQNQRQYIFEIIATGPQCALMRRGGVLVSDSNRNLEKYYRREVNIEW